MLKSGPRFLSRKARSAGGWKSLGLGLQVCLAALISKYKARWQRLEANRPSPKQGRAYESHLQKCCERALDAYTVEDAIFWHTEVINEISVEIYTVANKPWSDDAKRQAVDDLTALQMRHGVILHRLTGIATRGEQFVWEPQSVFKR